MRVQIQGLPIRSIPLSPLRPPPGFMVQKTSYGGKLSLMWNVDLEWRAPNFQMYPQVLHHFLREHSAGFVK